MADTGVNFAYGQNIRGFSAFVPVPFGYNPGKEIFLDF